MLIQNMGSDIFGGDTNTGYLHENIYCIITFLPQSCSLTHYTLQETGYTKAQLQCLIGVPQCHVSDKTYTHDTCTIPI